MKSFNFTFVGFFAGYNCFMERNLWG